MYVLRCLLDPLERLSLVLHVNQIFTLKGFPHVETGAWPTQAWRIGELGWQDKAGGCSDSLGLTGLEWITSWIVPLFHNGLRIKRVPSFRLTGDTGLPGR